MDSFCVHTLDEALLLREQGFSQDILIMGPVPVQRLEEAVKEKFRLVMYDREALAPLNRSAGKMKTRARIHLKLETGTHRQGIDEKNLSLFLSKLKWFVTYLHLS